MLKNYYKLPHVNKVNTEKLRITLCNLTYVRNYPM